MQKELPCQRFELLIMVLSTKLDKKLIGYITMFERITGARVKDVFDSEIGLLFIVHHGDAGKAIGRRGNTIKKLTFMFKKKIKIIEHNENVEEFVKNVLDPLKVDEITVKDQGLVLTVKESSMKGKIIGRNGKNLQLLNDLLQKYFKVKSLVA